MVNSGRDTLVDLIRHGEPEGGRRYRGQSDDPLNEEGWRQMWSAVGDRAPWQHIVTSPLRRCAEFATVLGARLAVPVTTDARFKEIGFGAWEGRTPDELRRQDPDILRRFYNDPVGHCPDGAEPVEQFVARIAAAWRALLDGHAGRHVLVVGHAGVTRAVTSLVLGFSAQHMFRVNVGYAGITRIRIEPGMPPGLVFHNSRL